MRCFPRAALLALLLGGCFAEAPSLSAADGGAATCKSDDDCDAQPVLRACRNQRCVDPGCPLDGAYVGAGDFTRGCAPSDTDCEPSAQPVHAVTLTRSFCISRTELTVAQYRQCAAAGQCPAPPELRCSNDLATWTALPAGREGLPLSCLLFSEAAAAGAYLGGRLPTEAEWEKAARGRDRRAFAWGRAAPVGCDQGVNWAGTSCAGGPWDASEAGRKGAMLRSAAQAVDMAGNLWEWTADYYAEDAYAACSNGCVDPPGPATGILRSRRGGSFQSAQTKELRTWFREFGLPEQQRYDGNGARCVFPAPP
jgi:formylglycine-generating enzyme required for sulfatase activity